jgi:glutaredoxin 3
MVAASPKKSTTTTAKRSTVTVKKKPVKKSADDIVSTCLRTKNAVVIFSKTYCPYCMRVKSLMQSIMSADPSAARKQIIVVELDQESQGPAVLGILGQRTGRTTVPQVFFDGVFLGGCDDTHAAHSNGRLIALLKQ